MQAEYPDSDFEPVTELVGGHPTTGCDLRFFYLDFVNVAVIRGFRTPLATCLVLCQAEDREYESLRPVFQAITTSLLAPV